MTSVRTADVVPTALEALRVTGKVPVDVDIPTIAEREGSKVNPGGRLVAAREVACKASN